MLRILYDARLALLLALCLVAFVAFEEHGRAYCAALHSVTVDGEIYEGGCTSANDWEVSLAIMSMAPLAAVAAMSRPKSSLRRMLLLFVLVALELALIRVSIPGKAALHPGFLRNDPVTGRATLLLVERASEESKARQAALQEAVRRYRDYQAALQAETKARNFDRAKARKARISELEGSGEPPTSQ